MTKTLYDPEVERRGYEKGEKSGYEKGKIEIVLNMYSEGLSEKQISKFTNIDVERVQEIIKKHIN